MGYEGLWKALADLINELRRRGETISPRIMKDLRSAKTMIQILKADPTHAENLLRIETYLGNVEAHLLLAAQDRLDPEHIEQWMKKLENARRKVYDEQAPTALRFVPGLPRDKGWIRIQVSEDLPSRLVENLAESNGLSCKMGGEGGVLVWGEGEALEKFIQELKGFIKNRRRS